MQRGVTGGSAERDYKNMESEYVSQAIHLHLKLSCQNFETHINSAWPLALTLRAQTMGVCQSTFWVRFSTTDITIHLMTAWNFHNDGTGPALTTVKDHGRRRPWDQSCWPFVYPCSMSARRLGASPHFSVRHHGETRSDVNTKFTGSSSAACTNNCRIQVKAPGTAAGQYVSNVIT